MARPVVLSVNGERLELEPSGERLIDVIRDRTRFKSVKLGCGEGGCGACAVSVVTWDASADKPGPVRTINACLAPVGSLDGCAITTSEGLGNSKAGYHAVQEQIAKHHGSQCGFCTPGIVVACNGVLERAKAAGRKATPEDFQAGLDGNLCRCTGWRPILDACKALADVEDLCSRSSCIGTGEGPACSGNGCSSPCQHLNSHAPCAATATASAARSSPPDQASRSSQQQQQQQQQSSPAFPAWLRDHVMSHQAGHKPSSNTRQPHMQPPHLGYPHYSQQQQQQQQQEQQQQLWLQPQSLAELWSARQQHPAARLLAGNTGAGIFKDAWPHDAVVIDVRLVAELHVLGRGEEGVTFGGALTIADLVEVLRSEGVPECSKEGWQRVAEHVERIAGHHVRSAATLGGHFGLCRSRPLQSDLCSLFMALGAQLQLSMPDGAISRVALEEYLKGGFGGSVVEKQMGSPPAAAAVQGCASGVRCASSSRAAGVSTAAAACTAGSGQLMDATEPGSAASLPGATAGAGQGASVPFEPVVAAVLLPYLGPMQHFWSGKVALRYYNSHALVNAALSLRLSSDSRQHPGAFHIAAPAGVQLAASAISCGSVVPDMCGSNSATAADAVSAAAADSSAKKASLQVVEARLVIGHPSDPTSKAETWACGHAAAAEAALTGQQLTVPTLVTVLEALAEDLGAAGLPAGGYHARALEGLVFQALVPLLLAEGLHGNEKLKRLLRGCEARGVPTVVQASQHWQDIDDLAPPMYMPVEKDAVRLQASGKAMFTSDIGVGATRQLYAAVVKSSRALALIAHIDPSPALNLPGVVSFISASDIPANGMNATFGSPLFAEDEVAYIGQPIGLLVATSAALAERAAGLVDVQYKPKQGCAPVLSIQQAVNANSFYFDPSLQQLCSRAVGDVDAAMLAARNVIRGARYQLPAQQHFCMEPQVAVAVPGEDGQVTVHSATQSLDAVQAAVAGVLGLPHHQVVVVTKRLGGAFGGKASRSLPVAAAAALAATKLGIAVHHSLSRDDDFRLNGGRCYGEVEYDVGFDDDGMITACDIKVILRAGAFLDLAFNDAAQFVNASDSAYVFPNMRVTAKLARCNLPPHTIMRGPGYIQGVMVSEQILEHVAATLGLDSATVKQRNFIKAPTGNDGTARELCVPAQALAAQPSFHRSADASISSGGNSSSGNTSSGNTSSSRGSSLSASMQRLHVTRRPCAGSPAAALAAQRVPSDQSQLHGAHCRAEASRQHAAASCSTPAQPLSDARQAAMSGLRPQLKVEDQQAAGQVMHTALGHRFKADAYTLPQVWEQLRHSCQYDKRVDAISKFNDANAWRKCGIAMTPVRFDCNPQPVSAAVSVYADGSICVSHGGIEMGQGLSTKVKQAAVFELGQLLPYGMGPLPLSLVRLAPSSTEVVPGGGPTWSSTGSEGCVQAVRLACDKIAARLAPYMQAEVGGALTSWKAAVARVHKDPGFAPSSVMLSAYGYYDGTNSDGKTVSYSAFGAACSEVEINLLTGERSVLRTDILYDCGRSLNPAIDIGQVEGAFVQGVGMWVCEEVVVDEDTGALLSDSSWLYKIPTPDIIPHQLNVSFLEDSPNPRGVMGSKASGEPALMTSTSVLSALQQATAAAAKELAGSSTASHTEVKHVIAPLHDQLASLYHDRLALNLGTGMAEGPRHKASGFKTLCAPATPVRLLAAIGGRSVADVLKAALEDGQKCGVQSQHGMLGDGSDAAAGSSGGGEVHGAGISGFAGGSAGLCAADIAGIAGVIADDDWEVV